jgi:hypothetical protein
MGVFEDKSWLMAKLDERFGPFSPVVLEEVFLPGEVVQSMQSPFERVPNERGKDVDVIALDDALQAVAQFDPRKAKVVELGFFRPVFPANQVLGRGESESVE